MNAAFIERQIAASQREAAKKDLIGNYSDDLVRYSSQLWGYLGFVGLLTPWHEAGPTFQINIFSSKLTDLIDQLKEYDIDLRAYAIISLSIAPYSDWENPCKLYCDKSRLAWARKLREYAASSERFVQIADLLVHFMHIQIERDGKAFLNKNAVVNVCENGKGKYMEAYHRLCERINQLVLNKCDPNDWLTAKVAKLSEFIAKDQRISIKHIININGVEPDFDYIRKLSNDPWKEVRLFLGLSIDCEFVDGSIPKGWLPQPTDMRGVKNIRRINKEGIYFYEKGDQMRGLRHYVGNSYFLISCTPENFGLFKDMWRDKRYYSSTPTWEEYSQWGLYQGMWDAEGNSLKNAKSITWRKL